jgi:hypothetical protein
MTPVDTRPKTIAQITQPVDKLTAPVTEGVQLVVEIVQCSEEVVTLGLQLQPRVAVES